MSLEVLHPGTFSLLVDRGRPATRSLGIPFGGPADVAAYQIGNALAGNSTDVVALEMTFSGPTLRADCDVSFCVFGAPFEVQVDGRSIPAATVVALRTGQMLKIGSASRGARGYLCVKGGFRVPCVLGSGTAFEPIAAGEQLRCDSSIGQGWSLEHPDVDSLLQESTRALRIIDGPQADWFATDRLDRQSFLVTRASNRMGVRLQGQPMNRRPRELISEAVAPGVIQITNEGLPIILGVDGQTIGGYPKIAHVIQADLDRVGQLRPDESIRFQRVEVHAAEALAAERRGKLKRWLTALRIFTQP